MTAALVGSAGLLAASNQSPGWTAAILLLPLLFAIRTLAPRLAAACGLVWGASLFAFLSLGERGLGASPLVSAVLLAVVPAAYAFAGALFTRRFGFSALLLGFGWAGVELALSPFGLRGGLLVGGIGAATGGFLGVLYSLLGVACFAAFIAAINGLLLSLISRAYIRVRGAQRLAVRSASDFVTRLLPREVRVESVLYFNPAHARAPPA